MPEANMVHAEFENFSDNDDDWLSDLEISDAELGDEFPDWTQEQDEPEERPTRSRTSAPSRAATPSRTPAAGRTAARPMAARATAARPTAANRTREARRSAAEQDDFDLAEGQTSVIRTDTRPTRPHRPAAYHPPAEERTRTIIERGRLTAARGRFGRGRKMTIVTVVAAVATAVAVMILFRPHAQWPASVALVKSEITAACQNPNVVSEPNQVNFACSDTTNQILWVFALMTSGDNPNFADAKAGRNGLEPIAPAQGGAIAWSLNLHHPYNPDNPLDSLEVAARAINNIVGGATITGANGKPTVQPGLESSPANCARYTGSSAIISHAGFPSLCAEPITSSAGQALLVANIYQSWVVGTTTQAAENVSVLFENSNNPGAAQVQAILKTIPGATTS
jgi:hypothetical protein